MLPPLFDMDDYWHCLQNNNDYCKVRVNLEISSKNEEFIRQLMQLQENNNIRDPLVIYRAICLEKHQTLSKNISILTYLSNVVNKRIQPYNNVSSKIDFYTCTNGKVTITNFDIIILICLVLYSFLVLFATVFDRKHNNESKTDFLSNFSLYRNWKNRTSLSKNEDYKNLLCIQGMRFYTMIIVVFIHVMLLFLYVYSKNPELFIYYLFNMNFSKYLIKYATFAVLPFFVISSWLLVIQIHNVVKTHGKLSLKHVAIITINRYFRFLAAAVFVLLTQSNWKYLLSGPLNFDIMLLAEQTCSSKWMYSVLFLSNFLTLGNTCHPVTWYLSADYQMYIITIMIIYVILKFKLNTFWTHGLVLAFFCIFHGLMVYIFNCDVVLDLNVRHMELRELLRSMEYVISYSSTFAIASSSYIGIILGGIYVKFKKTSFFCESKLTLWGSVLYLGLPNLAIILSLREEKGLITAILGSIVRPLYCFGIGLGLLIISRSSGGILKRVMEMKFIVTLSNFSFLTYMCHPAICAIWYINVPPTQSIFSMFWDFFSILVVSMVFGILLTLTIEEPCLSLQKFFLPQLKKCNKVVNNNKIK